MILHTGGRSVAATSTRSSPASRAISSARFAAAGGVPNLELETRHPDLETIAPPGLFPPVRIPFRGVPMIRLASRAAAVAAALGLCLTAAAQDNSTIKVKVGDKFPDVPL